jgi:hypothetical protein
MKFRKLWGPAIAAIAVGTAVTVLLVTGILAKDSDQGNGKDTLIVYANTAIGHVAVDPSIICVESSLFSRGQQIVWRIRVLNPAGNPMDDTQLKSVVVQIPGSSPLSLNASYGGHPGGPGVTPTDHFWAVAWTIPNDYPTGTFPYEVTATALHGNPTGTFNDFNVLPSLLRIK